MSTATYNGYPNYETWNAVLWILNDPVLYNTARTLVEYAEPDCTPTWNWRQFINQMNRCGEFTTGDGVRWDDPAINPLTMGEVFGEFIEV